MTGLFMAGVVLASAAGTGGGGSMHAAQPIVRIAEISVEPSRSDAYAALLKEEIQASVQLEPGVLALHAVRLRNQPDHVRLLEIYADQQAYEAHLKSPHFLQYKAASAGMVRSLELLETDPILLCSKGSVGTEPHCVSQGAP